VAYLFCNRCGHRNPPASNFCSACGTPLDSLTNQTITIPKVELDKADPTGEHDQIVSPDLPGISGALVVRSGSQMGENFALAPVLTRLGRSEDNEISLDDITVSRRHAEVTHVAGRFMVRDLGSLNGTYVNGGRIDEAPLLNGDELQVGKFRLVFFCEPTN
jgi:pSer/pThr/pTyr-binding forkhead associated (FHA) protein